MNRTTSYALAVALLGGGCVDHDPGIAGTQSIGVELVSPSPGDLDHRLGDDQRTITVNLTAYDAQHQVDTSFDRQVEVYVQFLGTITPPLDTPPYTHDAPLPPLATVQLTAGRYDGLTVSLPTVYGAATLWIEDGPSRSDPGYQPTYATGTSPPLWFRDPFVADIQRPVDETDPSALTDSPLDNKQITVDSSRHGAVGRLVVTSVFSQGYTVSDVACADAAGTPPCTAEAYDHVEVFSFSQPRDSQGRLIRQGQTITSFSGGITDFNGLTEIGFPATTASSDAVDPAWLPAPVVLDPDTWFKPIDNPDGIINFERNEAAPIEIHDAVVCPLDDEYDTYKQWKLDPSGSGSKCNGNNVLNVITAGVIADLDPATLVGQQLPRVVGVLRPVEIGTFYVWIIYPRSADDLTLP